MKEPTHLKETMKERTALHYAAEGVDEYRALKIIQRLLHDEKRGSRKWEIALEGDKYGRNVLHLAAFLGRKELCRRLLDINRNLIDAKDRDGQSAIYYTVAGPHDDPEVLNYFISSEQDSVFVKDFNQTTPLHVAAARGNLNMVKALLSLISKQERRKEYVEAADVLGQTALHKAASGGHWKVVEMLLARGAHALNERYCGGKTALHFAVQANGGDAVKTAALLLESCESDKQGLLLFASAEGIGFRSNPLLDKYLKQKKRELLERIGVAGLLRVAARLGNLDMARECVARGANIALLRNENWIDSPTTEHEIHNVKDVPKNIDRSVQLESDKPALRDTLGRSSLAIGLAALFLNPSIKSPINVGIIGEWGKGKSSVMAQTESILLKTAAQLAFTSPFQKNDIFGTAESKLSVTGQARRRKTAYAIERLDAKKSDGLHIIDNIIYSIKRVKNFVVKLLSAVHLVLATCQVNVIMSMENSIIQRAIIRKYGNMNSKDDKSSEDLADKYLRKIVQLPLHLPDPSDKDSNGFLESQLYMPDSRNWSPIGVGKYSAYGHRKANPKFQIGTSIPEKPRLGRGGTKKDLAEPGAKQQKALSISDMAQQGLERTELKETIEKAEEASGIEEATIEIDETTGLEKSITADEEDAASRIEVATIEIDEEDAGYREQPSLYSIISALLVLQYTQGEMNAFRYLNTRSARSKLPRERKCFMAYHRLAWTILYLTFELEYADPVEGWQVQLIAWIFVCWEWRNLMTTLIQKWNKLEVLRNWKGEDGPSLRDIVEHYIHERWPTDKKSTTENEDETIDNLNNTEEVEKTSGNLPDTARDDLKQILEEQKKMREDLTKVREEIRDMMKMIEKNIFKQEEGNKGESSLQQGTTIKENQSIIIKKFFIDGEYKEGESSLQQYTTADDREEWRRLRDTLRVYNVSMDGIQAFQNFRFNCESGYLAWPLPQLD